MDYRELPQDRHKKTIAALTKAEKKAQKKSRKREQALRLAERGLATELGDDTLPVTADDPGLTLAAVSTVVATAGVCCRLGSVSFKRGLRPAMLIPDGIDSDDSDGQAAAGNGNDASLGELGVWVGTDGANDGHDHLSQLADHQRRRVAKTMRAAASADNLLSSRSLGEGVRLVLPRRTQLCTMIVNGPCYLRMWKVVTTQTVAATRRVSQLQYLHVLCPSHSGTEEAKARVGCNVAAAGISRCSTWPSSCRWPSPCSFASCAL